MILSLRLENYPTHIIQRGNSYSTENSQIYSKIVPYVSYSSRIGLNGSDDLTNKFLSHNKRHHPKLSQTVLIVADK